jgi:hypothetical protein
LAVLENVNASLSMLQNSSATLIFVYNADATLVSQAFDFVHKVVSPQTYNCNLCRLTYGVFTEKMDWREFVRNLPMTTTFLHRDQFRQEYPRFADIPLPAVFIRRSNDDIFPIIDSVELNHLEELNDLKSLLTARLGRIQADNFSADITA